MYRDSEKVRVAARDNREIQTKIFKISATITLSAFLISKFVLGLF